MTLIDALKKLKNGKKIRHKKWNEKYYFYANKEGCIYDSCGRFKEIMINEINDFTDDNWEIYDEKTLKEKMFDLSSYCFWFKSAEGGCQLCSIKEECLENKYSIDLHTQLLLEGNRNLSEELINKWHEQLVDEGEIK